GAQGVPGTRARGPRRGTGRGRHLRLEAAGRSAPAAARTASAESRSLASERVRCRTRPREHRVLVRVRVARRPHGGGGNGMNPTALEASSLGRRYGRAWALRDCSLSLPSARVVALVGPNGAGKTTLLHLATGLLQPSSGSIRILGEVPGATPEI